MPPQVVSGDGETLTVVAEDLQRGRNGEILTVEEDLPRGRSWEIWTSTEDLPRGKSGEILTVVAEDFLRGRSIPNKSMDASDVHAQQPMSVNTHEATQHNIPVSSPEDQLPASQPTIQPVTTQEFSATSQTESTDETWVLVADISDQTTATEVIDVSENFTSNESEENSLTIMSGVEDMRATSDEAESSHSQGCETGTGEQTDLNATVKLAESLVDPLNATANMTRSLVDPLNVTANMAESLADPLSVTANMTESLVDPLVAVLGTPQAVRRPDSFLPVEHGFEVELPRSGQPSTHVSTLAGQQLEAVRGTGLMPQSHLEQQLPQTAIFGLELLADTARKVSAVKSKPVAIDTSQAELAIASTSREGQSTVSRSNAPRGASDRPLQTRHRRKDNSLVSLCNMEAVLRRVVRIIADARAALSCVALQSTTGDVRLSVVDLVNMWTEELNVLQSRARLPETVIALVGHTGSGKSSVMNALIGHAGMLPTSGIQACTSVVVQVNDNPMSKYYEATVDFLTKDEWQQELDILLKELENDGGQVRARQPDPNSPAASAWNKVRAVYGGFPDGVTVHMLPEATRVTRLLGRQKTIKEATPVAFSRKLSEYIESTSRRDGGQFWPVVKKVSLRIPGCSVCSSGATLVDLPGIRDSNAARDKIAKQYLQHCTAVWVVASIHRAVDDKMAKELLGEHFRRQLLMDGKYRSVSFVCTKSDILVSSELIRGLGIEDKVAPYEKRLAELDQQRGKILVSRRLVFDSQGQLSDPSLDQQWELLRESSHGTQTPELEKTLKMNQAIQDMDVEVAWNRKSIASICALTRNEFVKTEIKLDFKAGLRELSRQPVMADDCEDDDEDEFESEAENDEIVQLANHLKVFCVSTTEYLKLQQLLPSQDGPPQVFKNVADTGIPELEEHVHMMTQLGRRKAIDQLIHSADQYIRNVQSYFMDKGTKNSSTRCNVRVLGEELIGELRQNLTKALQENFMRRIKACFESDLKQQIQEGTQIAISQADSTVAKWGATSRGACGGGGLHWSTYKSTCWRSGVFRSSIAGSVDFNAALTDPFYAHISVMWDQVFNSMLFEYLEEFKTDILVKLNNFLSNIRKKLELAGVSTERLEVTETHLKQRVKHSVTVALSETNAFITDRQREINRVVTPDLQESMKPAYRCCMQQSGKGAFGRMKEVMKNFVADKKQSLFENSSDYLVGLLWKLQHKIEGRLAMIVARVVHDCTQVLEPLWQEPAQACTLRHTLLRGPMGKHTSLIYIRYGHHLQLGIKLCRQNLNQLAKDVNVHPPLPQSVHAPPPELLVVDVPADNEPPAPQLVGVPLDCGSTRLDRIYGKHRIVNLFRECTMHTSSPTGRPGDDGRAACPDGRAARPVVPQPVDREGVMPTSSATGSQRDYGRAARPVVLKPAVREGTIHASSATGRRRDDGRVALPVVPQPVVREGAIHTSSATGEQGDDGRAGRPVVLQPAFREGAIHSSSATCRQGDDGKAARPLVPQPSGREGVIHTSSATGRQGDDGRAGRPVVLQPAVREGAMHTCSATGRPGDDGREGRPVAPQPTVRLASNMVVASMRLSNSTEPAVKAALLTELNSQFGMKCPGSVRISPGERLQVVVRVPGVPSVNEASGSKRMLDDNGHQSVQPAAQCSRRGRLRLLKSSHCVSSPQVKQESNLSPANRLQSIRQNEVIDLTVSSDDEDNEDSPPL